MKSIGEITYDEKKLLGQGAFGKVYEGKFRSEKVAVKKMKRLYESFNEAIIQDTLCCQHENITGIFEIENDMSHIYIAMEYCDGVRTSSLFYIFYLSYNVFREVWATFYPKLNQQRMSSNIVYHNYAVD